MRKQERRWMWVKELSPEEKGVIAAICQKFITDTLKPRFLERPPTVFNYPVDILGHWRGNKYSTLHVDEEFNAPFARLDHIEECVTETRFDVMWHRHTGKWWRLYTSVTLEEALKLIETEGLLHPF